MTMISDLPPDLVENVVSRVPLTSKRRVRFTCKQWNALSKDASFAKKHFGKSARLLIMRSEFRVWLMSFNFHGSHNGDGEEDHLVDPLVKEGKLTSLNNTDQVEISKVVHCNGLLLCLTRDKSRLVVWNPFLGQTRWIEPRIAYHKFDIIALGYDINNNQKILRVLNDDWAVRNPSFRYEIYDLRYNSWRVLDVTPDFEIDYCQRGLSLKGSTYFFAKEKIEVEVVEIEEQEDFLLRFDFTREIFGPRLPLPFHSYYEQTVALSSVREEQLVVLYQRDTYIVEIWVTNKMEPNTVSWSKFLSVDMVPLSGPFLFFPYAGSFFIDEERKLAVVFDKDKECFHNTAYVIGENGYYEELYLGEDEYHEEEVGDPTSFPLVCSYFPTSVKIQQCAGGGKRKERDY